MERPLPRHSNSRPVTAETGRVSEPVKRQRGAVNPPLFFCCLKKIILSNGRLFMIFLLLLVFKENGRGLGKHLREILEQDKGKDIITPVFQEESVWDLIIV